MKRQILTTMLAIVLVSFSIVSPASAQVTRFDTQAAMQEEWDRYIQYKEDYIAANHLTQWSDQISEQNLMSNFGFYGPQHYAISPEILNAKYNPPLQGQAYYTNNRGYTNSLNQPSAVKFYAEQQNGRYVGAVPSTLNGVYFDHPQANLGVVTRQYASGYGMSYNNYGIQNNYPYNYPAQDAPIRAYARVAEQISDGYFILGYY